MAITMRRVGSKVKLTPKAAKNAPDLTDVIGTITYRPIQAWDKGAKRPHIRYTVNFGKSFGSFSIRANELRKA
ncbi:MAG: hypothetical protein PHQ43_09025 [Dehalococcoidales bacterium]|nr:hypothetical protein [Dehalococcoidales bacterium]